MLEQQVQSRKEPVSQNKTLLAVLENSCPFHVFNFAVCARKLDATFETPCMGRICSVPLALNANS